jgi:maltooligosyltrehalose trehalohydrolase
MSDPGRYRAMVALWLFAPQTPMLFQGQELGTSRPFVYFSDHHDDLAKLVREGRREELSAFRSTTHPEQLAFMADASARQSFLDSKLDDITNDETNPTFLLFRDLLKLRREDPIIRTQNAARIDGALIGPDAFAVRYFGEADDCRLLLINLGNDLYPTPNSEPLLAPPAGAEWKVVWFSEHPRYGGSGIPPFEPGCPWRLSGRCAVLMAPVPSPNWSAVHAIGSAHGEDYDIHPFVRQQRRKEG